MADADGVVVGEVVGEIVGVVVGEVVVVVVVVGDTEPVGVADPVGVAVGDGGSHNPVVSLQAYPSGHSQSTAPVQAYVHTPKDGLHTCDEPQSALLVQELSSWSEQYKAPTGQK